MIRAAHNRFYEAFLGLYLRAHMNLAFRHVRINSDFDDRGGSILLIGNHFSWWDGFIARHVNKKLLGRRLHLMMDEEQLARRSFLRRLGAFSIRKNSRAAIESLRYAAEILQNPENLLIVFPQGRFESLHSHQLTFEKGWFRMLHDPPPHLNIVFMASLVDYFASPRPGLTIYLQDAKNVNPQKPSEEANGSKSRDNVLFRNSNEVAAAYNAFYADAVRRQNQLVAQ